MGIQKMGFAILLVALQSCHSFHYSLSNSLLPGPVHAPLQRRPYTMQLGEGSDALNLLKEIQGTDRGIKADRAQRARIDSLICALESSWKGTNALDDPRWKGYLYRNCEVSYVGQSDSNKANAAGGRFRGRLGRLVFRTTALFQHILDCTGMQVEGSAGLAVNVINVSSAPVRMRPLSCAGLSSSCLGLCPERQF